MTERRGGTVAGTLEADDASPAGRLAEERAMQILERAAALDAKRSSEFEVDQLREAAVAAGISAEAFEQAVREHSGGIGKGSGGNAPVAIRAPGASVVAHYGGILRDLLGDEARVVVVDDRIEGRNQDGVTVSINPRTGDATASLVAEGSLRRRLLALSLPAALPGFFGVMLALEDGDPGIGMMVGVALTVVAGGAGTVLSYFRERKDLKRKLERICRQLQRMMGGGPDER